MVVMHVLSQPNFLVLLQVTPYMLLFAESSEIISLSCVRPVRGEHAKLASLASCGYVTARWNVVPP